MNNTAEITNDGVCVYFRARIRPDRAARVVMLLVNAFSICMYLLIVWANTGGGRITGGMALLVFVVLPVLYLATFGLYTAWNLFGHESIIINTRSISCSYNYGFFTTRLRVIPFKKLYYRIHEHEHYHNKGYGIIHFTSHNHLDVPVIIFTSAIYTPMEQLQELVAQIDFIFTIENLTDTGVEYPIHLN